MTSELAQAVADAVDAVSEERVTDFLGRLSDTAPFCHEADPYPLPTRDEARVGLAVHDVKAARGWNR